MVRRNQTTITQLFQSFGMTPNGALIDDGREAQLVRREEEVSRREAEYRKRVAEFERVRVTSHENEARYHARLALVHQYQITSGKELGLTHRLVVDTEQDTELICSSNKDSSSSVLDIT